MSEKRWRDLAGPWTIAAASAGALLGLGGAACDKRLAVRCHTISSGKLTAPVRLALLADLHSCAYGPGQRELLEAMQRLAPQPDAVLLAGDIVDDRLPEKNAWNTLSALAARYPCFYVTGNHEKRGGAGERICKHIEELGIRVLRGDRAELDTRRRRSQRLQICGIDDQDFGQYPAQLERAGASLEEGVFAVLLAHRPEYVRDYLHWGFDLVLCGHAHGGQWRLPGLVNGLYAPGQGLFPRYAGGRYELGEAALLVSRGLARETIPIPRIFNRPELVAVDLVPR